MVPAKSLKPCDILNFDTHCDEKDCLEEASAAYDGRGWSLFYCEGWWVLDKTSRITLVSHTQLCTKKSKEQPPICVTSDNDILPGRA